MKQAPYPIKLTELEEVFRSAWTGINSTPYIVDAPISRQIREIAEQTAAQVPLGNLFGHCPTLAVWAVLTPLARNYGGGSIDVYSHISAFLKESFSETYARDILKSRYRQAARKLGLPVSGTTPTDLFFSPLGPARSQFGDLAGAFVGLAAWSGPPAIEDTPSARSWQRRAVYLRCAGLTRLKQTISFDQSAHCARRFEAWRQGSEPLNDNEEHLFEAYDRAVRSYGRSRQDLTGPPTLYWTGDRLGIEAEKSRLTQLIRTGPFPIQLKSGERVSFDPPWSKTILWTCGMTSRDVPLGPSQGEVLIFDADSGSLLSRVESGTQTTEVAAQRLIILAGEPFRTPGFGESLPAADPDYFVAWIAPSDVITFEARGDLSVISPQETAIWVDGAALARDGSRALLAADSDLVIKLDPEIGGTQRIVRARTDTQARYSGIQADEEGVARISFMDFGFSASDNPTKVIFEVLAPGAAGDPDARSELSVSAFFWPGVHSTGDEITRLPCPGNFNASRSAGLRKEGEWLFVDLDADLEAPILGLDIGGEIREFHIRTGAETLLHNRLATGERRIIARGAMLTFGHNNRHDTVLLRSSDRDADLLVLGQTIRRPFYARISFEINAEMLEQEDITDDRIALRRQDGRIDIFARFARAQDPSDIQTEEDKDSLTLFITPQMPCDALLVRIEAVDGTRHKGEIAFGHLPAEIGAPRGVSAQRDPETGRLAIRFDKAAYPIPAKARFWAQDEDHPIFKIISDVRQAQIVVGLGQPLQNPDQPALSRLAGLLADPVPAALENQIAGSIGEAYSSAFGILGKSHMVGAVRSVLNVTGTAGSLPRHDLADVAPWIFEASPHALKGIPEASGLAVLNELSDIPSAPDLPDPEGDAPLMQWLTRVTNDPDLPAGLDAGALQHAFRTLRFRLRETDLRDLTGEGRLGATSRVICATWTEALQELRAFDSGGGGDDRPARMAIAIERFARAAALHRCDAYMDDLAFRTGLPRPEIGRTMTLMLRGGAEFFLHFRALWSHACQQQKDRQ